jgi:hypothetical protein
MTPQGAPPIETAVTALFGPGTRRYTAAHKTNKNNEALGVYETL